jgi:hypothetical protein
VVDSRNPLVIERILRDRTAVWQQVHDGGGLTTLLGQMLTSATIALACYGAVLGAQGGALQIVASAVKLPVLFLLTLAICLPTLYLFNLVLGARLSLVQATALVGAAITVTAVLSLAFAPISLFFLVTAPNYEFYKVLNVAILMLAGIVGLGILVDGMRTLNRLAHPAPARPERTDDGSPDDEVALPGRDGAAGLAEQPVNMGLVRIWVLLFGFVGTQLAWTLRPFVGSPDQEFQIFRKIEGNFYVNIMESLNSFFS